jgi:FtsP/CotA-like multicopper oxidase with cupredoxin domain/plastocyanin
MPRIVIERLDDVVTFTPDFETLTAQQDAVFWVNEDCTKHSIAPVSPPTDQWVVCDVTPGNSSSQVNFQNTGDHTYRCTLHGDEPIGTITVIAALALVFSLFFTAASASAQTKYNPCEATNVCQDLKPVPQIVSDDGVLRGVIDLQARTRSIIDYDTTSLTTVPPKPKYPARNHVLRAYQGYQGLVNPGLGSALLPDGSAYPGPTLRARAGEKVQLLFLNRIDPAMFPKTSVTSKDNPCDSSSNEAGPIYPGPGETFPNCFHASNTSNLHFHGTHISPGGFGDNVLIGVLPDKSLDAGKAMAEARKVFDDPQAGSKFADVAKTMLVKMRDDAKAKKNSDLAAQLQTALDTNKRNREAGEWPQYWPGFYPYTFTLPIASGSDKFPVMGQSPGTHWYHAHQHGSTTTQSLNGMSGVFVITGDYDDKLLALGGGTAQDPKIAEKVMIFQLFQEQPNLVLQTNAGSIKTITAVNGQVVPTVRMKKGEVQWWRIANAAVKANGTDQYLFVSDDKYQQLLTDSTQMVKGRPPYSKTGSIPRFYQTAQDGVQFDWTNYQSHSQPVVDGDHELTTFPMAPGNRADLLVQAPQNEGTSYMIFWPALNVTGGFTDINRYLLLRLVVEGDAIGVNTSLPSAPGTSPYPYPGMPGDLADIDTSAIRVRRNVTFSMSAAPNPGATSPLNPPQVFIDGKKFNEGIIDQVMLLGGAEEWTILNTLPVTTPPATSNGVSHPFHIHVNPFQIAESCDPSLPVSVTNCTALQGPLVWSDTVSIPAAVTDPTGKVITPGYVKIRSRFVDFPGKFVLHCHILGHEDRGMMQLVQVLDNKTVVKHH